jgi:dynein heavy chain
VELRGAIDACVVEDFDTAAVYTQQFDTHRVIFEFGKAWNPSAYSAQKLDLRQYHQDMSKQRDWRHELEKMKIGNVVSTQVPAVGFRLCRCLFTGTPEPTACIST